VLKAYTQFGNRTIEKFRGVIKNRFRKNFIDFFSDKNKSEFEFYEFKGGKIKEFVEKNFRKINGKCFLTKENKLILARHKNDGKLNNLTTEFKQYEFE
jgi:hypothetical protein